MLHEHSGDIFLGDWRSADLLAFCLRVFHSAFHSCADHRKLQLTEHASHLQEGLAHRIGLTVPTVKRDAPHDHKLASKPRFCMNPAITPPPKQRHCPCKVGMGSFTVHANKPGPTPAGNVCFDTFVHRRGGPRQSYMQFQTPSQSSAKRFGCGHCPPVKQGYYPCFSRMMPPVFQMEWAGTTPRTQERG